MLYDCLLRENPTYSPATAMEGAVEDYENAFKEVWGIEKDAAPEGMTHEQWKRYVEIRQLAKKLAEGAATLR